MEIFYRANDGVIFTDEHECELYEEKGLLLKEVQNSGEYCMLDADGDDCTDIAFCYYLKVYTERALKYIEYTAESIGVSVPEDFSVGSTYYYDDYCEKWHNVDVEIEKLKNIKEMFK